MQYQDQRTPPAWEVGDLIISTTEQRYMIVGYDIGEQLAGKVSIVNTTTMTVVMTRDSIDQLKTDFTGLYPVTELIKGADTMVVSVND